jgi:dolichyl-phosphate beta-glucosyltransferase
LFSRSRLEGFAFDVELFHLVERFGLSLAEVPVVATASSRSTVRLASDAARMMRDVARVRHWATHGVYGDAPAGELSVRH